MTQPAIQTQADPDPEVSIIIVSWNTRDLTLEAIRSCIEETQETSYELLVVDNNSADGSADAIEAEFPDLALFLREPDNHGFAKANNIAAKHARGKYLLLLNPDTVTLDGAIDKLVAFAKRSPDALIWGGRTVFADKSPNYTSIHRHMSLWSLFCQATCIRPLFTNISGLCPEGYTPAEHEVEREVGFPTGAFYLVTRELWEALGGFDLDYVMYAEEADLALRGRALGARPRYTPDAVIVHLVGASSAVRTDRIVMLYRAKVTMVRRFFSTLSKPIALALFWLTPVLRGTIYSILGLLTSNQNRRDTGASWLEVFRRRREWYPGYPKRKE